MWRITCLTISLLSLLAAADFAWADTKVEQQPVGPDGESLGCSISPKGSHVAVLATKGSRFVVLLDGVEGPRIDALLTGPVGSLVQVSSYWTGQVPIVFSDDGLHSAYAAKVGNEFIVVLDGKELSRGPITNGNQAGGLPLTFTAGGKHLLYIDVDPAGKYRLVVDGKPGPAAAIPPQYVVSADGAHYAYVGYERTSAAQAAWSVVDGRQVNYFGDNLKYTGKGALMSRMSVSNEPVIVLNGKPAIKAARLDPMWMSPDGSELAVVITPKNGDQSFLSVNGKTVPGTEGLIVNDVYFSPDGKRYAARCDTKAHSQFMIIDGKKGQEYQSVPGSVGWTGNTHYTFVTGIGNITDLATARRPVPGFTADSSKFVYVAVQGARQFMVIEDQESNGFQTGLEPILSMAGHHIGVIGVAPNGKQHVIIDDKEQEFGPTSVAGGGPSRIHDLTFSPDGSHCAFVNGASLCVDWAPLPGFMNGVQYAFSPDGKHVVYLANDGPAYCVFLDGKIIDSAAGNLPHPFFSPDSRHIFWAKLGNLQAQGTKDSLSFYVDGKPVTHYSDSGLNSGTPIIFEFSPDDVLTFAARTDEKLRRFRVTPSPDANLDTILAAAQAPKAK